MVMITRRCMAKWLLRHADLLDIRKVNELNDRYVTDRQISQKFFRISVDEMYQTICVEWAKDHFSLKWFMLKKYYKITCLCWWNVFSDINIYRIGWGSFWSWFDVNRFCHFSVAFDLLTLNLFSQLLVFRVMSPPYLKVLRLSSCLREVHNDTLHHHGKKSKVGNRA